MNFYKHHLGDYDTATQHLTWNEDMAYTRLLRVYYSREKPIPREPGEAYRLVRATTKAEKEAVTRVLHEFFEEANDGWHNKRADEEISAYQAQASTNRRIAEQREAKRRVHEPQHGSSSHREPNHEPLTTSQKPKAKNRETVSGVPEPETNQPSKTFTAGAEKRGAAAAESETGPTWAAYAEAYRQRYGVDPVRNAKVNSQLGQFVKRVPAADAPAIAAFYVRHPRRQYVEKQHSVGLMLIDAEGLATQWRTNHQVTSAEAAQTDKTAAQGSQVQRLLRETGSSS